MQAQWQSLLAALEQGGVDTATEQNGDLLCFTPLQHQRLIAVAGADTDKFLQGQLTCDLREVTEQQSLMAAHCTPKGGMLSLMRLIRQPDQLLLRLHQELLEGTLKQLGKYIIFSKAELTDVSERYLGLGVSGAGASGWVAKLFGSAPTQPQQQVNSQLGCAVCLESERFELWIDSEYSEPLQQALLGLSQSPLEQWLAADICAGIPDLRSQTLDSWIPQMVNLQAIEGVSFRKGCYTGQEVVTRLQFRGKLGKYMLALTAELPQDIELEPGSAIANPRQDIGKVVYATRVNGRSYLLAVVNKLMSDDQPLSVAGHELSRLELPYEIDPALFERKQ